MTHTENDLLELAKHEPIVMAALTFYINQKLTLKEALIEMVFLLVKQKNALMEMETNKIMHSVEPSWMIKIKKE